MILSGERSLPCLPTELVLQIVLGSLSDTITYPARDYSEIELFQSQNRFFLGLRYSYRPVMLSCSWLKSELLRRRHSCPQFLCINWDSLRGSNSRTDINLTETLRQRLCVGTTSPLSLFVGFEPRVPKVYLSASPEDWPRDGKLTINVTNCI